ncbi:UNVERIFIED_ORG: hypothetical protein ABIB21_003325 [Arthrobacter sp. UYEF13]
MAVTGGGAPALDGDRLAMLHGLGQEDGLGLLPATTAAFRKDVPARLAALHEAVTNGGGPQLVSRLEVELMRVDFELNLALEVA